VSATAAVLSFGIITIVAQHHISWYVNYGEATEKKEEEKER
jgi:hypothetical protein